MLPTIYHNIQNAAIKESVSVENIKPYFQKVTDVDDSDFAKVITVEAIVFGNGNNVATFGTNAASAVGSLSITGGSGNNTFDVSNLGEAATIMVGAGADTIIGGTGGDSISGSGGADSITSGAGNDSISGGADNDTLVFGAELTSSDTVDGGSGTGDILTFTDGNSASDDLNRVTNVETNAWKCRYDCDEC